MDFQTIDPPMPSLSRYRALTRRTPGASILRAMEYEALETLDLQGNILDYGGGQTATYVPHLPGGLSISSINIDEQYKPTHLVEVGEALPFDDSTFDGAICLNVLEHIYDTRFALSEMLRTLKPGATLHIAVPWMFRVHGHPDDYSRHTSSWWRETMRRTGFSAMTIQPLVWGKATSGQMIRGNGVFKGLNTWRNVLTDIAVAKVSSKSRTHITGKYADRAAAVTPGWLIAATK